MKQSHQLFSLSLFVVMAIFYLPVSAQRDTIEARNITTTSNMFGIGGVNILDTYISPEKYRGAELRFISITEKRRPNNKLSYQRLFQINASIPHNRVENAHFLAGMINYSWGLHYNLDLLEDQQLNIKLGGLLDGNFGGLYSTRSSNNPGQLKAYINITPSIIASYDFQLLGRTFSARYGVDVPLLGVMFSPHYGQSYYEIFSKGETDHNIIFTTIGCAPSLRQMLTIDVPIGEVTLRVGYLGDLQQAKVNGIKSHSWSNVFMIGYVKRFKISRIR